ncbi:MAG: hypothetical protein N2747_02680 [Chitinophagaceae bacterium]|nr:hypothetical protein [Chitinophagaceae bacterium]
MSPFWFYLRLHMMKKAIEEKLEKENIQTITVSQNDLIWIKKNKEAIIGGRFFDVKEIVYSDNNSIRLKGLFDDEETEWHKQLMKNEDHSRTVKFLIHILHLLGAYQSIHHEILCFKQPREIFFPVNTYPLHNTFVGVTEQPPWNFSSESISLF